jgi:hypothetical protein
MCIISKWELLVFTTSLFVLGLLLDHNSARYLWTGYMCGSNLAMEALESPNLDCVSISVQFVFFHRPNNSSYCAIALIVPGTILVPAGLLITGWSAQNRVFWLVPDIVSDLN